MSEIIEVKIEDVAVDERQREELDLKAVKQLAESINLYGQLNPIIIDENLKLVAGLRRMTACMMLERDVVQARVIGDLSDLERQEIELEENIRRKDLTWAEKAKAIQKIHIMKAENDPNWDVRCTAAYLDTSIGTVSQSTQLAEALAEHPELEDASTLVGALQQLGTKKKIQERKKAVQRKMAGKGPQLNAGILTGDARDLIKDLNDGCIDAIVTNPPFGIDLKIKGKGQVYEDDDDTITDMMIEMCHEYYRVLKDDAWVVSFFDARKITYSEHVMKLVDPLISSKHLSDEQLEKLDWAENLRKYGIRALGLTGWLELAGFNHVTLMPCVWVKPNKIQGSVGSPGRGIIVAYEALVFAAKGKAELLKQGRQNIFIYDTAEHDDRVHSLQMPNDLCQDLVSLVALGGETVLDPFAGSGSIGIGALENQCEFIGFELNPEYAENGNMRLAEHTFAKKEE